MFRVSEKSISYLELSCICDEFDKPTLERVLHKVNIVFRQDGILNWLQPHISPAENKPQVINMSTTYIFIRP